MKKIMILVATMLVLVGCNTVDQSDMLKGKQFCKDKFGVKEYRTLFDSYTVVECINGEAKDTFSIKLKQQGE